MLPATVPLQEVQPVFKAQKAADEVHHAWRSGRFFCLCRYNV